MKGPPGFLPSEREGCLSPPPHRPLTSGSEKTRMPDLLIIHQQPAKTELWKCWLKITPPGSEAKRHNKKEQKGGSGEVGEVFCSAPRGWGQQSSWALIHKAHVQVCITYGFGCIFILFYFPDKFYAQFKGTFIKNSPDIIYRASCPPAHRTTALLFSCKEKYGHLLLCPRP